jgi:hypothetical protein
MVQTWVQVHPRPLYILIEFPSCQRKHTHTHTHTHTKVMVVGGGLKGAKEKSMVTVVQLGYLLVRLSCLFFPIVQICKPTPPQMLIE